MRHSPIALVALIFCGQVDATAAVPAKNATSAQAIKAKLRRAEPVPAWAQALADIPRTDRSDAVVLRLNETQVLAGDRPAYLINRAIQVNDRSALAAIGQVSLTYYPAYQSISLHRVAILRDGKVLDRTATVEARTLQREAAIEQGVYGGADTIQLLLEDVRVGDTLWLTYSTAGANPVFGKRWFDEFGWDQLAPVERRRLIVMLPKQRQFAWRQLGDFRREQIVPRIDTAGPYQVFTFDGNGIEPIEAEPSIAPDYQPVRSLQFSEFPDWASVAAWASELFPAVAGHPVLKTQADHFRKAPTPAARAAAALHWVQDEIRYFSVSIGENSHRPQTPATVLKRRYGDCKDKSYLLISLLAELGIQARPVLLSAASPHLPAAGAPSPGRFDHVIVEMQIDGKRYFVDPTRTGQQVPLDVMSTAFPGASALVVDPATSALTVLPEQVDRGPAYEVIENVTVADYSGDATMETREIFRSAMAESARPKLAALSPLELKQAALKDYEKRYPGVALLDAPVLRDNRETNELEVRARYRLAKAISMAEGAQAIEYQARTLDGVLTLPDKLVRSFPLEMPAARYRGRYRLNVTFPDDMRAFERPWSRSIDNQFFRAEESYVFRGNQLNHMVDYQSRLRSVPAADVIGLHEESKLLNELAQGRFTARLSAKVGKEAANFSARDADLLRMAIAADEMAQTLEKQEDAAMARDKVCLFLQLARDGEGMLQAAGQTVLPRAKRIIMGDKQDPAARVCRARMAFEGGDLAASAQLYQQLGEELAMRQPEQLRHQAWAHLYGGRPDQALATMDGYTAWRAKDSTHGGAELDLIDRIALMQRTGRALRPEMQQRASDAPDGPWPRPLLAMQAGLITQDALVKLVEAMPEFARPYAMTEALFYLGQARLAARDKTGAVAAFVRLQEVGIRSSPLYLQGMGELLLLRKDAPSLTSIEDAVSTGALASAVRMWSNAAHSGDPTAQYRLGWAHEYGKGVAADLPRAVALYQQAADGGNSTACLALARLYGKGQGVPRDPAKASTMLRRSAELGHEEALALQGWTYLEGGARDYPYAALWFQRAALRGSASGAYGMGRLFYDDKGPGHDLKSAAQMYLAAAKLGHADAQLDLGYMYEMGEGVAKDLREAVAWYRKAADQGNALAQYNLAQLYQNAKGVGADLQTAASWLRRSAEQGYLPAVAQYGFFIESGKAMQADPAQAHGWYLKAAEGNNALGQYNVAQQFKHGRGVAKDHAKAVHWYQRSAAQGDADAMFQLASAYEHGEGVPQDLKEAFRWYTAAAEGGETESTLRLAVMYFNGSGIERDYVRAHKLLEQAVAAGHGAANYWLGQLYENGLGVGKDESRARALYARTDKQAAKIRLAVLSAVGRGGARDAAYADRLLGNMAAASDTDGIEALALAFDDEMDVIHAHEAYERLVTVLEAAGDIDNTMEARRKLADSYLRFQMPLKAEPLFLRLLAFKEQGGGAQHEDLDNTLDSLADVYVATARLQQAELHARRVVDLRMAAFGKMHGLTSRAVRKLAVILAARGDLKEAQRYLAQAQADVEREIAPTSASFAAELSQIGQRYYDLGQYPEAEALYRRALANIGERGGPDRETESPLNGLAWTLGARGAHAEAERVFRRVVALRERLYGKTAYSSAAAMGGLGLQLAYLGHHAEAEQILRLALALREPLAGKFDGEVAIGFNQAGIGWARQGKALEAENAFKHALALRERVSVPVNPDIAESLHELGALYLAQRRIDQAAPLLERALAIRLQLMPTHPDTRATEKLVADVKRISQRS